MHDQILGGLNGMYYQKTMSNITGASVLESELGKLYRKHKKTGCGWLSEYGATDHKEFLSESFVLYNYAPEKLPADVRLWFDQVKDFAKNGKMPNTTSSTRVIKTRKPTNNKPQKEVSSKSQVGYIPYSDKIKEQLKQVKGTEKKNKIFESVINDDRAKVINETDTAKTTIFDGHRSIKGETWKNTKQKAIDLNNNGVSVCFLPEYNDSTSADTIVQYNEGWRIANFKCSGSTKSNTIQIDVAHAFKQADCCVLKLTKADKGVLDSVLDYFVRNGKKTGDLIIINKMGNVKCVEAKHIQNGRYKKILKGFL